MSIGIKLSKGKNAGIGKVTYILISTTSAKVGSTLRVTPIVRSKTNITQFYAVQMQA